MASSMWGKTRGTAVFTQHMELQNRLIEQVQWEFYKHQEQQTKNIGR